MISDAERYLMRGRSQLRDTPKAMKDLTIMGLRKDVADLLDENAQLREELEEAKA